MKKFLKSLFHRVPHDQVAKDQLYEARRLVLEHEAAAEHHDALAVMYRNRVERLSEHVGQDDPMAVQLVGTTK